MKVSRETAAANREALLSAAGRLYREKGFDEVSAGEIAAAAGVTHGALYGHFASKDALRKAVLDDLFGWTAEQVGEARDLTSFLDIYLSRRHVDHPGAGCPLATLGGDVARADRSTKADFARGLERLVVCLSDKNPDAGRGKAISSIAAMVGAVLLARASGDKALADEVLKTVREDVEARLTAA